MKAFYKDEANTRLKSLDTNDDGKVSWDEYTESAEKKGGNLFVEKGVESLLCTAFSKNEQ